MAARARAPGAALVLFWLAPAALAASDMALDACAARLAEKPQAREAAECFYLAAQRSGQAAAAARLEALIERHPDLPWLHFYLGNLHWLEPPRAVEAYQRAAEEFSARRDASGEVQARTNLYSRLQAQGAMQAAGAEVELAQRAAEASGDPLLLAQSSVLQARYLHESGGDLGRAVLLLEQVRGTIFPSAGPTVQRDWLQTHANLAVELGRREQARTSFEQLRELARRRGNAYDEAAAWHGLARLAFEEAAELPSRAAVQEARAAAADALQVASAAGHRGVEAFAHHVLGMLRRDAAARRHLEHCLAAAPSDRHRSFCLRTLARHLGETDPRLARSTLEQAFVLAHQAESPWSAALCWRERMRLAWADSTPEEAVIEGRAALDAIEALHDIQRNTGKRAELSSTWAEDYHWLSGKLLQIGRNDRGALEAAFQATERMRARSLLEALSAAGQRPRLDPVLAARRAAVVEQLAQVQRRLLVARLPAAALAAARREQERLELQAAELTDGLAPGFGTYRRPDFATLPRVQRALSPGEVLLSFQVAPWRDPAGRFAGGAWLVAATLHEVRVYPLPGRVELRQMVAMFEGLFPARTPDAEARAARALHRRLLAPALADLAGVERLILVPDDDLHRLPFAALRANGKPLGTRYQVTVVPSATLWLRWRQGRPEPGARPALALADPPAPGASGSGDPRGGPAERGIALAALRQLPPLPYARSEGRAVVRHFGPGSLLRVGDAASEDFLKRAGGRFGFYHFAAHAILDDERPERSWVLLAPGARDQDGLLQAHEIAELDFQGAAVVLASCRSASGRVLRGEGVMGLARAFFQAGAHAVVASLWPLRDDDAEALFASFYRHLGRGESLAAALRAAQAERIRAGAPAAAWAGLVVLGDGELVPVRPRPAKRWIATALLAAYGAGALLFAFRRPPGGVG